MRVGIIGGGIGGLSAGLALKKKGISVSVFDKAAQFLPNAGAGFGFSPNGQACVKSLGVDVSGIVHPFDRIVRLDKDGNVMAQGHVFKQVREKFGVGIAGTVRADLVRLLAQPLGEDLHYKHKLIGISENSDKVKVLFEEQGEQTFDLLIGADGINSTVANLLKIDESPPTYSGANIWYGVIDNPDLVSWSHPTLQNSNANNSVIQGPGTGEFISFRCGSDSEKLHVWACTYKGSLSGNQEEWGRAGRKTSEELQMLLSRYPAQHPIHELAGKTKAERLLHFPLYFRQHKSTWTKGRVCLLGDSCHATLPYAGQGANQAIEDSIVLADCLVQHPENHHAAFSEYFHKRSTRTKRVVNMANFMDKLYHSENAFVHWVLDKLLANVVKGGFIFKQIESEIVNECPVDVRKIYLHNL